MKIGLVVDDGLDKPDGVQQFVVTLGKWLSKNGHEIHYVTSTSNGCKLPNLHVISRSLTVSFNGNRLRIPMPSRKRNIKKLLSELDLDIIHVQMPYNPFLGGKVIKCAGNTPVVGTFHILPYGKTAAFGSKILGCVQQHTIRRLNYVTSTSEPTRIFASQSFSISSEVVPHPVDIKLYTKHNVTSKIQNPEFKIVYLGRLVERKGVVQLLKAINELKNYKFERKIKVIIGGKGPLLESLKSYCTDNNLDMVEFIGFVAEDAKPEFLSQADLCVFPAISGESFGIVLIEAMAANGGAVIAGNNPGYSSVLSSWPEAIFDPQDTDEFAYKLKEFIVDDSLRGRILSSQRHSVKQYDVSVICTKYLEIYGNALQNRSRLR